MALAFRAPSGGGGFVGAGGTSAAALFWAGLIALADRKAGHALGLVNPATYRIAHSPQYHSACRDITPGNNTVTSTGTRSPCYKARLGLRHRLGTPQRTSARATTRLLRLIHVVCESTGLSRAERNHAIDLRLC